MSEGTWRMPSSYQLPRFLPRGSWPADWEARLAEAPVLNLAAIAGCTEEPPQFALLGRCPITKGGIAVNLNAPLAAGFFGVNGSGKSYAMYGLCEALLQPVPGLGLLRSPHCVVAMHHHPSADYEPELLYSCYPNLRPGALDRLVNEWLIPPVGLPDVVVLTVPDRVLETQLRHPFVKVLPIRFPLREIGMHGLSQLVGLDEPRQPLYARQLEGLLRRLVREQPVPRFDDLLAALSQHTLDEQARERVALRLSLMAPWIDDDVSLRGLLRPGRLIIVDVRDSWLQRVAAMDLFALVLSVLVMNAEDEDGVPVTVALDEAHKFVSVAIIRQLVSVLVRERRHLGSGLLLSSQDPCSVPQDILALLDLIAVFNHASAKWARHLSQQVEQLKQVTPEVTSGLPNGMAILWSKRWYIRDPGIGTLRQRLTLLEVRPRLSLHGGETRTAVRPGAGRESS